MGLEEEHADIKVIEITKLEEQADTKVLEIIEPEDARASPMARYPTRAAIILGCIHLLCGCLGLVKDITGLALGDRRALGIWTWIWTSGFFIVSGSFAIAGAHTGWRFTPI